MIKRYYKPGSRFVYVTVTGGITAADVRNHIDLYDREYPGTEGSLELADCTGVTSVSGISISELADCTRYAEGRRFNEGGKLALLVGGELHFGMARVFATVTNILNRKAHVFRDRDEALVWLGLKGKRKGIITFIEQCRETEGAASAPPSGP